jgi:hypothetical protein
MSEREYQVPMTQSEMKCLANVCTNLLNRMAAEKKAPSPESAITMMNVLNRFKTILERQEIVIESGF